MSVSRAAAREPLDGGEAWTREVLEELRDGRFMPRAWIRLIARSLARASEERTRHRRGHRQSLALAGGGLVAWVVVASAGQPGLAAVGAGWWASLILMLDWHLGMLERDDGSLLDGLGAANVVTTIRGGIVPLFPALDRTGLLVAFAVFGALDVVDGRLARARNERTRLGAWLDGSLDSLAVATVVVAAERLSVLPLWLVVLVLVRHGLPWLVAGAAYFVHAARPPSDGFIPARLPGLVLAAGIVLALLRLDGGVAVAAVGAAVSTLTFLASVARTARRRVMREPARPMPDTVGLDRRRPRQAARDQRLGLMVRRVHRGGGRPEDVRRSPS